MGDLDCTIEQIHPERAEQELRKALRAGVASLVVGIMVAIVLILGVYFLCPVCLLLSIPGAIVGLIFGRAGRRTAFGVAGMVLSVLSSIVIIEGLTVFGVYAYKDQARLRAEKQERERVDAENIRIKEREDAENIRIKEREDAENIRIKEREREAAAERERKSAATAKQADLDRAETIERQKADPICFCRPCVDKRTARKEELNNSAISWRTKLSVAKSAVERAQRELTIAENEKNDNSAQIARARANLNAAHADETTCSKNLNQAENDLNVIIEQIDRGKRWLKIMSEN